MLIEKKIDDLIKAGWDVLESDFDTAAFRTWKKQVRNCLAALGGPDHTYTRYFEDYVKQAEEMNVLAGAGILAAAKEQIVKNCFEAGDTARQEKQRKKEEVKHV